MKNTQSDIVIVGGGASGLAAAVQAAQLGAAVTVLEKMNTFGGQANMGTGICAVESHHQVEAMYDLTVDQAFEKHMEFTHWTVDARIVKRFYALTADTIRWAEGLGVEFIGCVKYFPKSLRTWHPVKVPGSNKFTERSGTVLMKALYSAACGMGVQFEFNTSMKDIVFDEDGFAVGVEAETSDGEKLTYSANAVIIGTGGFCHNQKLVKEMLGDLGQVMTGPHIIGIDGDGIKTLWKHGAAKAPMAVQAMYRTPSIGDIYKTLSEGMRQFDLCVDLTGRRFMNEAEMQNTSFAGHQIANLVGYKAFTIINDEIVEHYKKHGPNIVTQQHNVTNFDDWDKEMDMWQRGELINTPFVEAGIAGVEEEEGFWVCDTLEEVCKKTGVNLENLEKTIATYNSMAYSYDKEFNKPAKYMKPIHGGKYYVALNLPAGGIAPGGVRTNENMEVMRTNGETLPGLYACGSDANNINGECYYHELPASFMGFAVNSGRIAAMECVNFLRSDLFE